MSNIERISREELEQIMAKGITDASLDFMITLTDSYVNPKSPEHKEIAQKYIRIAIREEVKDKKKFTQYLNELDSAHRKTYGRGYYPASLMLNEMLLATITTTSTTATTDFGKSK